MEDSSGMIYVFMGEGKGKTSAALGVTTRMLCIGKRVIWVSWYKSEDWPISEKQLVKYFQGNLEMYWMGKGFYIKEDKTGNKTRPLINNKGLVLDTDTPDGHRKSAISALEICKQKMIKKDEDGGVFPDLIVMDEVLTAINDGLLKEKDVLKIVENRGKTNIVLTGRKCPDLITKAASLITEMRKVKHPYDRGVLAVRGLDY